jgi:hypothetical protein
MLGLSGTLTCAQAPLPHSTLILSLSRSLALSLGPVRLQVMCNDTLLNFDPSTTACDNKPGDVRPSPSPAHDINNG